jgi:hypothetical protein
VVLSVAAAVDHVRVIAHAYRVAPAHPLRDLTVALEAHGSPRIYSSDNWRAYSVTFLSGERLKVATSHRTRILE